MFARVPNDIGVIENRGVARNLLWGTKERVWGEGRPPVGSRGRNPQKMETNAISSYDGGMRPCPPGHATDQKKVIFRAF